MDELKDKKDAKPQTRNGETGNLVDMLPSQQLGGHDEIEEKLSFEGKH